EDGIRDATVTGVQTCALPICTAQGRTGHRGRAQGAAQALTSVVADLAVRVAADSLGGVAMAQLAATFVVTVVPAELRAVEDCKQAAAAHLARDSGERILRAGRTLSGVLRAVVYAVAGAAVGVADQHAPDTVDGDVVDVRSEERP